MLPRIYSVSARDALAAKIDGDAARLVASGLPALEDQLVRFLLERKHAVFLARLCARVAEFVDSVPQFDGSTQLLQRIQALSETCREAAGDRGPSPPHHTPAFNRNQLRPCEICAAVDARTWDFLAKFQYELATDRDCQNTFAGHSGLCCYHTAEYQDITSPLATCSGYPSLLERFATSLRTTESATHSELYARISALLPSYDTCPACAVRTKAEKNAISNLAERLNAGGAASLEKLSALCLPHLAAVAQALENPETIRALFEQHAQTFERTAEDMRRFTLKQSAARRRLLTQEEETAAQRGLSLVAGRRNVNFAVGQPARKPID